ncbi:helix-turn-helix domain-containing protein [Chitinophaga filiformis]|uniref:Helix-turn-helix domain-containing protein n=1 Tax=Chitinophaga filiformis TaxID=104663 RepID=A0ABY4I356_CHIFI|nr:helix-turn-helix domain-containing protein [Chitinophaga filiformis]UPK69789.1 helix-turn-helix domain-containing protein [Chitinophaga filiformis]
MIRRGQLLTEDAKEHFFKIAYPAAPFQEYVDYYFEISTDPAAADFYINGLPSSNTLLAFNLNQQSWHSLKEGSDKPAVFNRAHLLGHTSILHTGIYAGGMHTFFVKLSPGIAALLFREAAASFVNTHTDLSCLWTRELPAEQLMEAASFRERIELFQQLLMKRMVHDRHHLKVQRLHQMMKAFHSLQLKGEKEIEKICSANWVSYASARRDFLQYIGFTPKYCQRISRLKRALKAYKKHGYHFYYEDYGYTDFSHFAKDSRQITGRPPSLLI